MLKISFFWDVVKGPLKIFFKVQYFAHVFAIRAFISFSVLFSSATICSRYEASSTTSIFPQFIFISFKSPFLDNILVFFMSIVRSASTPYWFSSSIITFISFCVLSNSATSSANLRFIILFPLMFIPLCYQFNFLNTSSRALLKSFGDWG